MAGQVRIADLPSTTQIDGDSYVIIEKPGVGQGTYKAKVMELQRATIVTASVTKSGDVITISIQDHTGSTTQSFTVPRARVTRFGNTIQIEMKDDSGSSSATLTNPTAKIINNGDGTSEIIMTDSTGTTTCTVLNSVQLDPEPTEGSSNLVTSGAVYTADKHINDRIIATQDEISSLRLRLSVLESIVARTVGLETNNSVGPTPGPSPEDYRFQLNGVGYDSIQDVIRNLSSTSSNSVKLNRSASTEGFILTDVDVTFDLGGNTWMIVDKPSSSNYYIEIYDSSNIIMKNGTLSLDNNQAVHSFIHVNADTLIFDSLTIDTSSRTADLTSVVYNTAGDITFRNGSSIVKRSSSMLDCYIDYGREIAGKSTKIIVDATSRAGVRSTLHVIFYAYYGESTMFSEQAGIIAPTANTVVPTVRGSQSRYYWESMPSMSGYEIFKYHS